MIESQAGQKENDFLHLRLQQLSKDVLELKHLKKAQALFQEKLEFYEAVIEEVTMDNSRLMLQLERLETLEKEKEELHSEIDRVRVLNQNALKENKSLQHELQV